MNKLQKTAGLLLIALCGSARAGVNDSQASYPVTVGGQTNSVIILQADPTGTPGTKALPVNPTNPLNVTCVSGCSSGSGTGDVNVKQVNGVTTSTGTGATGTGTQRVGVAQDATTVAGSAPGIAGTASTNVVTVQGIAGATAVKIDGSAVTQPISGVVTASAPVGITPTDRTITSASGSSQTLMSANARHSLTVVNTGNANCGINPTGGTAAIGGTGTLTIVSMGSYTPRVPTQSAVTVICTTGQPVYADEN